MRLSHQYWLNRIVLKKCLKLSMSHAGSLSSSGSEFQTVGPATGKARRPYVLSRQRGTISQCRLAERSRCRDATSMAGLIWSARYRGACPCKQRHEAELEGDSLRHIQPVQFVMKESRQTTIKFLCVAEVVVILVVVVVSVVVVVIVVVVVVIVVVVAVVARVSWCCSCCCRSCNCSCMRLFSGIWSGVGQA